MIHLLPITLAGGTLLVGRTLAKKRSPLLVEQLATPILQGSANAARARPLAVRSSTMSGTDRRLALSVGLLGMTAAGGVGLPLLRLLSLPGLLYLDVHFVRRAYSQWQQTRRVSIETNDAVLATGLLATGLLGAGALFAAFFFTSQKLQEKTAASISATEQAVKPAVAAPELSPSAADAAPLWQQGIDRGAAPLLALSAVSTPLLGVQRSLGVLLANFGYDFRVLAPLTTLSYLKIAAAHGIHVGDEQLFEQLQKIDMIMLDGGLDAEGALTLGLSPARALTLHNAPVTDGETAAQIAKWQAQGERVAYVCPALENAGAIAQADVVIMWADEATTAAALATGADVVFQPGRPQQLQQLFDLTDALEAKRKEGLVLAVIPSIVNLCGIYFWHFGPITALLVDYGGLAVGVVNSVWPQRALLSADLHKSADGKLTV